MDWDSIVSYLALNPTSQYELEICSEPQTYMELDKMTYIFFQESVITKFIELFETTLNEAYTKIIKIIFERYQLERFPSLQSQILDIPDQIIKTVCRLSEQNKSQQVKQLMDPLIVFLCNNPDAYKQFVRQNGYLKLQELYLTNINLFFETDNQEYSHKLVPQQSTYQYSSIFYYIYQLFARYKDEHGFMIHFFILLNQKYSKQLNTTIDPIFDQTIKSAVFHNMIFTVIKETQAVLNLMQERNLLNLLSHVQHKMRDPHLSFIIKLILQETMDESYADSVLIQLAQNCLSDFNLIGFLEKQLIERRFISKQVTIQTSALLLVSFHDDNFIDKNKRIFTQLCQIAQEDILEKFQSFLCVENYSEETTQFLYQQFLSFFQTKNKFVQNSGQLVITRVLMQLQTSQKSTHFNAILNLCVNVCELVESVDEDLILFISQLIQNIQFNQTQNKTSDLFDILTNISRFINIIPTASILEKDIHKHLLNLAIKHPIFSLLCLKILINKTMKFEKPIKFKLLLYDNKQLAHFLFAQTKVRMISQAICAELINFTRVHKMYSILLYIISCVYKCYGCNEPFKECKEEIDEQLVTELYHVWKDSKQFKICFDNEIYPLSHNQEYNQVIIDIYFKIEQLIIFFSAKTSSCINEQNLLALDKQPQNIDLDKYLMLISTSVQRQSFYIKKDQFLSKIPEILYYKNIESIIPINYMVKDIEKQNITQQKLAIQLNNFEFSIQFKLNHNGDVFCIQEVIKDINFFSFALEQSETDCKCFISLLNIPFRVVFAKSESNFYMMNFKVTQVAERCVAPDSAPFQNDIFYDSNLKRYKGINAQDSVYHLQIFQDTKQLGSYPIILPSNPVYILEQSYLSTYANCQYSNILIQQNGVPILEFSNGNFVLYRCVCLQQKSEKIPVINLSYQKAHFLTETELSTLITDTYLSEKPQVVFQNNNSQVIQYQQCVSAVYDPQLLNGVIYQQFVVITYPDLLNNIRTSELQQKLTIYDKNAYNKAQPIFMDKIQIRPSYSSLQQSSTLNIMINMLDKSTNIEFDLLFLSSMIWSSEQLLKYFVQNNSFEQIVKVVWKIIQKNNTLNFAQIVFKLFNLIGIVFVQSSDGELNNISVHKNSDVSNILVITQSDLWIQKINIQLQYKIIKLIISNQMIFSQFKDRLKIFSYIVKHLLNNIENEETQQLLIWISNQFCDYYCNEIVSTFISVTYKEIYSIGNIFNMYIKDLITRLTEENEEIVMQLINNLVFKMMIIISNQCQQKVKECSSVFTESVQKCFWFLSLIVGELLIILLEKIKLVSHILQIFEIMSIIESASQMVLFFNEEQHISHQQYTNHMLVQNTVRPLQFKHDIYKVVRNLTSEKQLELLPVIQQLLVNRYSCEIRSNYSRLSLNKNYPLIINNYNALFTAFIITQQTNHYFTDIPHILNLIQQMPESNSLCALICLKIINDIVKSIQDTDDMWTTLSVQQQKQSPLNYITKLVVSSIIDQDTPNFLDKVNVCSFQFVAKIISMMFKKGLANCDISLTQIRHELYSQLSLNFDIPSNYYNNSDLISSFLMSINTQPQKHLILIMIYAILSCCETGTSEPCHISTFTSTLTDLTAFINYKFSKYGNENDFCQYIIIIIQNVCLSYVTSIMMQHDTQNPSIIINYDSLQNMLNSQNNEFIFMDNMRDSILKLQLSSQSSVKQPNFTPNYILNQFLCIIGNVLNNSFYTDIPDDILVCEGGKKCCGCNIDQVQTKIDLNNTVFKELKQQFYQQILYLLQNIKIIPSQQNIFTNETECYQFCQSLIKIINLYNATNYQLIKFFFQVLQVQQKNAGITFIDKQILEILNIASARELKKSIDSQEDNKGMTESFDSFIKFCKENQNQFFAENKLEKTSMLNLYQKIHIWPQIIVLERNQTYKYNIESIMLTFDQSLNKHLTESKNNQKLSNYVENQLVLSINQQLADTFLNNILSVSQEAIGIRLAKQQQDTKYIISKSQFYNGECYQTLPLTVKSMHKQFFQTKQILDMFNKFKVIDSIEMYYSMLLQTQCNRVSFSFICDQFIYVFADSPHGEYFLRKKQTDLFKDFDFLVDAHIQEATKTFKRLKDAKRAQAELFTESFWEPHLVRLHTDKIISLFERDYGGLNSALDIHTNDGQIISLVFTCYHEMQQFTAQLQKVEPRLLRFISSTISDLDNTVLPPLSLADFKSTIQDQMQVPDTIAKQLDNKLLKYIYLLFSTWKSDKISTFKLIYELNLLAKRSTNDLSQYIVFPQLFGFDDLLSKSKPHARVLRVPVLFQGVTRLSDLIEKHLASKMFGDAAISAIHYAHCAIPAWFCLRMEPFASAHLLLQACRFDAPDRLLSSMCVQYRNSMQTSSQNCEEFLPEIFYEPIFNNINKQDLGKLQTGEIVSDVVLPVNNYQQMLMEYLENKDIKNNLYLWCLMIFSQNGYSIKDDQIDASLYPTISRYLKISTQDADESLNLMMKAAGESHAASAVMKLIYFGRQPQPLLTLMQPLKQVVDKNEYEQAQLQLDKFLGYVSETPLSQGSSDVHLSQVPAQKIKLSILIDNVIIVQDLIGSHVTFQRTQFAQKQQALILKPGYLTGRHEYCSNYTFTEKSLKTDSVSPDYRTNSNQQISHSVQQINYLKFNANNSLLVNNKAYVIPAGFQWFQTPGYCPDMLACYQDSLLQIFRLPNMIKCDEYLVGDATCFQITPSNFVQLSGTNDVFIGRKYGVVDVYQYSLQQQELKNIMYFPVAGPVEQMHYSQAWGSLCVISGGFLDFIVVPHVQRLFRIEVQDVLQLEFSSKYPLLFILERGRLRIINFRTLQEHQPLNEGFRCICYSDDSDTLILTKNSLVFKIQKLNASVVKGNSLKSELVGSLDGFGQQNVVKTMCRGGEVWAVVEDGVFVFGLDKI
ncbi:Lipopolysaccharide-responsive_and beige-like anchor protein [Hexamita inflata]|uniref:Lipopolysaccharide-responsive and beige-like anchor protein n=1 Tax=Hexamita inflata TaxID=28002 RepID=A0AA86TVC9_9EUKA|nr:Lipopolysaccharide-responsive and beige-like anchor protein [Hexamita inflata]